MLNKIFPILLITAVLCGFLTGNAADLTNAVLREGEAAIQMTLSLMGGMCVWGGILRIAEKSGMTGRMAGWFSGIAKHLFRGIRLSGRALPAITMNLTANLLGLGNAATPFGLEAVRALQQEDDCGDTASDNIILFTVLNTASLTCLPTTVAMLRLKHGSADPLVILPAVWLSSLVTLLVLITATKLCAAFRKRPV